MNMFCSKCWTSISLSLSSFFYVLCLSLIRNIWFKFYFNDDYCALFWCCVLLVFRWEIICMCVNIFNERVQTISSLGHRRGLLLKIAYHWICTKNRSNNSNKHTEHFFKLSSCHSLSLFEKQKEKKRLSVSIRICIEGKKKRKISEGNGRYVCKCQRWIFSHFVNWFHFLLIGTRNHAETEKNEKKLWTNKKKLRPNLHFNIFKLKWTYVVFPYNFVCRWIRMDCKCNWKRKEKEENKLLWNEYNLPMTTWNRYRRQLSTLAKAIKCLF